MRRSGAFTLVELLIVVSVIGVLSGILLKVIDIDSVKGKARDGVRISNMGKLVQALEAYCITEEECPANAAASMPTYVKEWPQAVGGNSYVYGRLTPTDTFALYVNADRDFQPGIDCYKYTTDDSKIKICPTARCGTNANMTGCMELAQ